MLTKTLQLVLCLLFVQGLQAQPNPQQLFDNWSREQTAVARATPSYTFVETANRNLQIRSRERVFSMVTQYRADLSRSNFTHELLRLTIDGNRVDDPTRSEIRRGPSAPIVRLLTEMPELLSAPSLARMVVASRVREDTLNGTEPAWVFRVAHPSETHPLSYVRLWLARSDNRLLAAQAVFRLPPRPESRNERGARGRERGPRPPMMFIRFARMNGLDVPVESRLRAIIPAEFRGRISHIQLRQTARYENFRFGI